MVDLATLEGLHGERLSIVAELESAERDMIDAIINTRSSCAGSLLVCAQP